MSMMFCQGTAAAAYKVMFFANVGRSGSEQNGCSTNDRRRKEVTGAVVKSV